MKTKHLIFKTCLLFMIAPTLCVPALASKARAAKDVLLAPKVILNEVKLSTVNFTGATFDISLTVNNPNTLPIVVETIRYNLTLSEKPIKNGVIHQTERFSAQSTREVIVPVGVSYSENLPAVLAALSSDIDSAYTISGDVSLRGFDEPFPFSHRGRLLDKSTP